MNTDITISIPTLLLITGSPAAGKTTFARALARATGLPLVTKDGLKEVMHDALPADQRGSNREIGERGMKSLFHIIESTLTIGRSIIAEANFDPALAAADIRRLRRRIPFLLQVIRLRIDPDTQQRRIENRLQNETRHPVHDDARIIREIISSRASILTEDAPQSIT